ncbi:hypothetical protein ACJRO7_003637 [Eucalyptus globulus]|uniref:DC1 domain-containing protein n=1 Tax=Eucalyptus globulus TaxID=34317 RepID=A0ABD3IXD4_EUCGL
METQHLSHHRPLILRLVDLGRIYGINRSACGRSCLDLIHSCRECEDLHLHKSCAELHPPPPPPPPHKHTHTQTIRFILSILCPWWTVISPSPDCALKPTTRYEFVGWENPTITQPLALVKEDDDMCSSHKKICSRESYSCHHRPSLKIHISCAEQLSEQSNISHIHNVLSSSEPRILSDNVLTYCCSMCRIEMDPDALSCPQRISSETRIHPFLVSLLYLVRAKWDRASFRNCLPPVSTVHC